jgi:Neuraminidase (sialidase)
MYKAVAEVSQEFGVSRYTLQQVAKDGKKVTAHRSGKVWLIDVDSPDFKAWLEVHRQRAYPSQRKSRAAKERT